MSEQIFDTIAGKHHRWISYDTLVAIALMVGLLGMLASLL